MEGKRACGLLLVEGKVPAKRLRKECSHEGCIKNAQKGGVCIKHGAKRTRKVCSNEGCMNWVVKGGVCVRHGAKVKRCCHDGCNNMAQRGGVCWSHGGGTPSGTSSSSSYTTSSASTINTSMSNGYSLSSSIKDETTSHEEYTANFPWGAYCRQVTTEDYCSHDGCTNESVKGGECLGHLETVTPHPEEHGAKIEIEMPLFGAHPSICRHEGCTNKTIKTGVCDKHGARPKCSEEGCTNIAQNGGICCKHGAKVKVCDHEGCTNQAKRGGLCRRHQSVSSTISLPDTPMEPSQEMGELRAIFQQGLLNNSPVEAELESGSSFNCVPDWEKKDADTLLDMLSDH